MAPATLDTRAGTNTGPEAPAAPAVAPPPTTPPLARRLVAQLRTAARFLYHLLTEPFPR